MLEGWVSNYGRASPALCPMIDRLQANPEMFAEAFDGESVLIDIRRGLYFSLSGAATVVWRLFESARIPEEVIAAIGVASPDLDASTIAKAIDAMRDHELLISAGTTDAGAVALPLDPGEGPFEAPGVQVFSDLAELIALDPVHEVNASAGWPTRPAGFPDVA